jgi:hypothetical protein
MVTDLTTGYAALVLCDLFRECYTVKNGTLQYYIFHANYIEKIYHILITHLHVSLGSVAC